LQVTITPDGDEIEVDIVKEEAAKKDFFEDDSDDERETKENYVKSTSEVSRIKYCLILLHLIPLCKTVFPKS
jgi:hypothetical protein